MTINTIGSTSNQTVQQLMNMRSQFDDLQRQLSTGQKSDTYAGLGLDRGLAVSLNAQSAAIGSYDTTIDNVTTRLNVVQSALTAMGSVATSMRSSLIQGTGSAGTTNTTQVDAQSWLQQLIGLLNTQAGDRYVFSGRATDQPATESYDHIINGDGAKDGLATIISQRNQADIGASGLGRLVVSAPTTTSVQLDEDSATSPFGFKLNAISSSLSNASVSGPSGSPLSESVAFTGVPAAGESVTFTFNLPDGTTSNLTLKATTNSPPSANEFTIGGTAAATASNLQSSLTTALGTLANTDLKAASAVQASNEFFDADSSNPPLRVSGTPATSTSLVAGTSANSVIWYTGEVAADPARSSASARIDQSLTVNYGTRASETGIRNLVQSVATRAAMAVSPSDPNYANLVASLDNRLTGNINGSGGVQTVTDIEADLAGVQTSLQSMKTNHAQVTSTLGSFLDQIQGVSNEQVGTQLLALQTRMQASMQTTALMYKISLVNYL